MGEIEGLILFFPTLKDVRLTMKTWSDVVDGYRWEKLIHRFDRFGFDFQLEQYLPDIFLDSFRTPFWIELKNWFVAIDQNRFYTIESFGETSFVIRKFYQKPISKTYHIDHFHSTTRDFRPIFKNTRDLVVSDSTVPMPNLFESIESLSVISQCTFHFLFWNNTLNSLRCITLPSLICFFDIAPALQMLPALYQISFGSLQLDNFYLSTGSYVMPNIRSLIFLSSDDVFNVRKVYLLSKIFPNAQSVSISSKIQASTVVHIIHRFKKLEKLISLIDLKANDAAPMIVNQILNDVWFASSRKIDIIHNILPRTQSNVPGTCFNFSIGDEVNFNHF